MMLRFGWKVQSSWGLSLLRHDAVHSKCDAYMRHVAIAAKKAQFNQKKPWAKDETVPAMATKNARNPTPMPRPSVSKTPSR